MTDPALRLHFQEPVEYSEPLSDLRMLEVVFEREYPPLTLLDGESNQLQYQNRRGAKRFLFL